MARTNAAAVQALLGNDYDADAAPSLTPRIETATVIVDRVATCATAKAITLTAAELELIERWLSAHFYAMTDQTYSSKSTGGASASFHGQTGLALDATKYGQTAKLLDYSGCLTAIGGRQVASGAWLGKRPSEQTLYTDRD
jgi:hypothetical protein